MRAVIYGAACSLDGFIADTNGAIDWLHFSLDVSAFMQAFWKRIDTVLMGRKTWEVATAQGGGGSMPGVDAVYIFSRTLRSIPDPNATLVSSDAGEFVRRLKAKPGKDICVLGGGDFGRSLFAAGLIDEVGVNIHPILLGSGVPLFLDTGRRISLDLIENRTIHGGCVLATYRVRH
jgi:dihydrofolate reductase